MFLTFRDVDRSRWKTLHIDLRRFKERPTDKYIRIDKLSAQRLYAKQILKLVPSRKQKLLPYDVEN